tara:strand:- start:2688 stop:3284 length:597 start_codon:yes stop_codon:yes gene_type:complete
MIRFNKLSKELPYIIFKDKYYEALNAGQKNIEAISIASYNKQKKEVDSRFVNLKIIDNDNFIFFSNYNSPKSLAFESHNQVSVNIYWPMINLQIRMKAKISKKTKPYNEAYFLNRSPEKNALAISSDQSKSISSYDLVVKKYNQVKKDRDLKECPDYWGGFSFNPYEIEFWEGNRHRLNKRNVYRLDNNIWHHNILEP